MKLSWMAGLLAGLSLPGMAWARGLAQEGAATPDERGHILKMTREMIRLGTTRDHGQRMDLFLRIADERVRELQSSQEAGKTGHLPELGRCYETLVSRGAIGTVEQGAASGRDMNVEIGRLGQVTSRHGETWKEFVARISPSERPAFSRTLESASRAGELARQAQERGLWEKFERRRAEERPRTPAPGPAEPAAEAPRPLEAGEARKELERRESERRKDAEERAKAEESAAKENEERAHPRGPLRHHRH